MRENTLVPVEIQHYVSRDNVVTVRPSVLRNPQPTQLRRIVKSSMDGVTFGKQNTCIGF